MEDLRSSRRPAKSTARGDVFGGAPIAAKSDDYDEIFGGIATSCSIPFLDLPPCSVESIDAGGSVDYSEIFGGFSGGDFAIDYTELFSEKKKKTAESSGASSNGRAQKDAIFGQQAEVLDQSSEDGNKDYVACSERNKFSSSSNHADDGSKQFMSYHRAPCGSIDDVISGKTHITQLHAAPGYTYTIDSCSSLELRSDNPPKNQTNDLIHNITNNGQLNGVEQETRSQPISFIDGADLRTNQNGFSTNHAASEDDLVNMKHHSRSSSNYSASSGDISYSDVTFVSISDINLRTQPSRVPPPSRAPPKFTSKQEDSKTKINRNSRGDHEEGITLKPASSHQIHYKIGAAKTYGFQGAAKDVEVDASSAAAASAAAMKEAMELAQARLKSAKELMERKRDNLQNRRKLGHKEGAKYDERKEGKASDEGTRSGVTARKSLLKEEKGMREYDLEDSLKATKVEKTSPEYEEKERCVVAKESCQLRQGNGFKSSQAHNSPGEVPGEWKIEEQFYELISNEKFRAVKEFSNHDNIQKKPMAAKKVNADKEHYSEMAEPTHEFMSVKLDKVKETIEMIETNDTYKPCNSHKDIISKVPEETFDICILKENKPEGPSSSYNQKANEDILISGHVIKKPDGGKEASCEDNKLNDIFFNGASGLEKIYHEYEKNRTLQGAKEHDDNEKESSKSHMISAVYEIEEKLKMFITGVQKENEGEAEIPSETCVRQVEELVANGESYLYESSSHTRGNVSHESCNEENGGKFEAPCSVSEHVESGKPVENDLQSEVAEDCSEGKGISEELKEAIGTIGVVVTGEKMDSSKETCQTDFCVLETCEADKRQNASLTPSAVENTVQSGVGGGEHEERENGNHKISNELHCSEKMQEHYTRAQDQERAVDTGIGHLQDGLRAENEDLGDSANEVCRTSQSLSHDAQETVVTVVVENSKPDVRKREKEENDRLERERDHVNEQTRKIEEEKEREREREKDRLAVERATREAHERALVEARERAERIAVERATAEARQRALAEAREKAEKASAEALERSLTEKALKEAKLRAERAAVERATAEARERAVEKALAEKAAADARQRSERLNTISREKNRKDNETGDYFRENDKEDRERKLKPSSSDIRHDGRFQTAGLSSNSHTQGDSFAHGEVESPLRCKARLERNQRTVERAAKALAEKNMRDILAQREQVERNRLAESLDAEVKRWSTGKEGNLRALLSTLQYILGSESGWQPIPLTEVITAAAVKKAYRKATLCVHPDKLQQRGASIQQKYICEKVFDLLKEAWTRFNSEER